MFRRKEALPRENSIEIQYMTEGLHLEDRGNMFQNGAWKETAILISGLLLAGAVVWGAVRVSSAKMVAERLSRTPTPLPHRIENAPALGDFLERGSQRWYINDSGIR